MRVWDGFTAFFFAVSICFVCWALFIAGWFSSDFTITVRPLQLALDTKSILLTAAIFLPALYCFVTYSECRSSVWRVNANWKVYLVAIVTGLCLPFTSYLGTHNPAFPWGRPVAIQLVAACVKNLFLMPLWEEIIWRGCFQKKIRSLMSAPSAILFMSVGWTVWHGAKIAFLYSDGIPIEVISISPFIYFCLGIILGSVFELGRESIWPSVLMHSVFNAAMNIYYLGSNRRAELGSYVSELIFMVVAAGLFFRAVIRANRMHNGDRRSVLESSIQKR